MATSAMNGKQVSGSGVALLGRTLFNTQDYNPDMQGQSGTRIYERMRRDPEIAGALLRWKSVVLAGNWQFVEPKKKTAKTKMLMDLCDRYILRVLKTELLPQMLLKLDFGVSAVEKIWGVNEQGQQVYVRFAPILPASIQEFEIGDDGQVERLVQYAYVKTATGSQYKRQEVPEKGKGTADEKIAVFTYRREGEDYFGRPLLREVYQPWFHKSELWTLDAMQKERAALGLTVIKVPGSVLDTNDAKYQKAIEIVQNVRASEVGGAVIGEDWELETSYPTGTPPDITASQSYCDEQINRAMLTQFAMLASSSSTGGGRSLGESGTDHFMLCAQALTDSCEEDVNAQLVPILCIRNAGPLEPDEMPQLKCEDLDKMSGTEKATILKMYMDAGLIRYDRKLEEQAREEINATPIDDATREEPPDPMELAAAQAKAKGDAQPAGEPAPAEPDTDKAKPPVSNAAKADSPGAAVPSRFWREPLAHEQHVQFEKMADYLDTEPGRIWHRVVKPLRDQQVERIAAAAAAATAGQLARGIYGADKKPREAKMASELAAALLDVYRAGRRTTLNDRARQMAGAAKADMTEDDEIEDDEALITPKQRSWIRDIAVGFATLQTAKMIAAAVTAGQTAHQANLPASEVEARVRMALQPPPVGRLSWDVAQADLAGAVTRSFTTGRVEQAQAVQDELTSVFYSAVMDQNTCGPCGAMDGAELDMGSYHTAVPNPECEGLDRCRCVPVFVFRPMENRQEAA